MQIAPSIPDNSRSAYLSAMYAVSAGITAIGNMADPVSEDGLPLRGFREKASAIARAGLIARKDHCRGTSQTQRGASGGSVTFRPQASSWREQPCLPEATPLRGRLTIPPAVTACI